MNRKASGPPVRLHRIVRQKVNWFADDERGIMYVREWDADQDVWVSERAIHRLSQVAQILNRMQIMPNAENEVSQ